MGARPLGAGLAGAALASLLALPAAPAVAEAAPTCEALQIRTSGATSVLHRVRLPDFTDVRVGELPYRMNALGYARSQGWAYGIAEGFADGGHVVALRPSDPPLDLGPVVAGRGDTPWNPIGHPEAGAIRGDRWYVLEDDRLYTVDVDRDSRTFRRVLRSIALERRHGPFSVDDVDVGPDGLLYGVAQTYTGIPAVVRLDPGTGVVEPVSWLPDLLPDSYGSVVIGRDGALYVTGNRSGGAYRIGEGGKVVKLAELPGTSSSDAAGCLRRPPSPAPPEPPPVPPPPTSSEEPPPPPTPSAETPPPSTTPPSTTRPSPARPTPSQASPPPEAPPPSETPETASPTPSEEPDSDETGHTTQEKRRWALAGLVLLIGGSAAVRRLGRG
ncbi:DUF6923 family protein [Saccharopolyspora flava]|uniref:DUF6923 domain-containing protein n=1 Tax=Saccharopolyspora flava TaxID=95161 RepID=A0A1I6UVF3_9PSEU|nr:hypothetical protein [Saccharopolyspora flava]SFT05314.1 hypothetical protein SAMN05660874_05306 [Saccharopolyspora flava]